MDIYLGPVPLEEVLFYLLTAAMVVQGFVIFWGGACDSWQQLALPRLRQRRLARADGQRERYVQH